MTASSQKPIICILGATASGKSDWAFQKALECGGEIITADAMQVYRGMDIGTAKPSLKMQADVPHHLLDLVNPDQDYDVARFIDEAKILIADCHQRSVLPIICGGTNYYIHSLLNGLAKVPKADWALREKLEEKAQENRADWLWEQLSKVDPISAQRLHQHDHKRIIRAIEVFKLTNKPLSFFKPEGGLLETYAVDLIGIERSREDLRDRINMRTDIMMRSGLIDEVKQLSSTYAHWSVTAREAIGYKETLAFIRQENSDTDKLRDMIALHTDQLVKKQLTWLKRMPNIKWL